MTISFLKKNFPMFAAVSIAILGNILVFYSFLNHITHKFSFWYLHFDALLAFLNTTNLYINGTMLIFLWRKEYDSIPSNEEIADNSCIFKSDFADWCAENKIYVECYWKKDSTDEFSGYRQEIVVKNLLNYKRKLVLLRLKI